MLGDFNMVLDTYLDRKGGNPRNLHTYGKHALQDVLKNTTFAMYGEKNTQIKDNSHGTTAIMI